MIVRHELTSKTEVCRCYENNQHAILSSKCWSKEMRTSDVEGGESVEVEIQKNVYGAALLAIAQVSVAGTRLERDGIMTAWFLPFKIHHNRDIWVPKSVCQRSQITKIVMLIVWLPRFKHGFQMPSGQELCEWEWQTSGACLPATSCSSVMLNSKDLKGSRIEFGIIWRWTKS